MIRFLVLALLLAVPLARSHAQTLHALIIDGQNNHKNWPDTTKMMKRYLEDTKRFTVDVATNAPQGTDPSFKPPFKNYNIVVSNYNGADWPKETQDAFVDYISDTCQRGDRCAIPGLGSFSISERKAREGRNPRTKEKITIPASKTVRFKAGKDLRDVLNAPRKAMKKR